MQPSGQVMPISFDNLSHCSYSRCMWTRRYHNQTPANHDSTNMTNDFAVECSRLATEMALSLLGWRFHKTNAYSK